MASVSKRGKTWEVRYRVKDPMGQIMQKRVGGFATKEDAWAKAGELEQAANMGVEPPKATVTVGILIERWFAEYATQNVAETTLSRYSINIDRLASYPIFDEPVKNLTMQRYGEILSHMQSCGGKDGKPLSPASVKTYLEVLRYSMSWATKQKIIPVNPINGYRMKKTFQAKEPDYLEHDDIQDILNESKGKRIYTPILLALYGGLRAEECLGLKWTAVNFSRNTITINEVRTRNAHGHPITKIPKTPSSRRTITMPSFVMSYLNQLPRESEYICISNRKAPYTGPTMFQLLRGIELKINKKRKILNQPPIPMASFHDLRHTHAAMLINLNVQPKVISERMGHSSIKITMDTYGYLMTGLQEDVANKLESFV